MKQPTRSESLGMGRLPLTIEEGARLFRGLRLGSATVEDFVSALRERAEDRAAWELPGLDRARVARLVSRAEQLLALQAGNAARAGSEAVRLSPRDQATRP